MEFNDLFIQACKRQNETGRIPFWFMRQAGRFQSTYRKIKETNTIIDICKKPEVGFEVTMLPVNQFKPDTAIIFSDILIPLEFMGISFEYKKGYGPLIHNPVRTKEDVDKLTSFNVAEKLHFTGDALGLLKNKLTIPCIGFVGAPFTLASYMIEGGPSKSYVELKKMMYNHSDAWHKLMSLLSDLMAEYLIFQSNSGAAVLQIFDSWIGILSREDFLEFVYPHTKNLIHKVKQAVDSPIILFGTNTAHLLDDFANSGADVMGIDWKTDIKFAIEKYADRIALQGNLDPTLLFADKSVIKKRAEYILESAKGQKGFIFNLGHGILPETPEEHVEYLSDLVRNFRA